MTIPSARQRRTGPRTSGPGGSNDTMPDRSSGRRLLKTRELGLPEGDTSTLEPPS